MSGKSIEVFTAYVQGRVQVELEGLSKRSPLSYEQLAESVGHFLLSSASGGLLGLGDNMSPLRGKTPKGDTPSREVEVARRPYRRKAPQKKARRKMSADARRRIGLAVKKRWAERKAAA